MTEAILTKSELESRSREAAQSIEQSALALARHFGVDVTDITKPAPCHCGDYRCDVEDSQNFAARILERVTDAVG